MKLPAGIINVESFGIPENYLKLSKAIKKEICQKIITTTLTTIKSEVPVEEKIVYMYNIFERNEKYYAEEEVYEASSIFYDLKNALDIEFKNLKKE